VPTFDSSEKKLERQQKIAEAAAKQCNRGIIPKVHATKRLDEIIKYIDIFAYENAEGTRLNDVLKDFEKEEISILVGPEGGFSEKEVELGIKNNCAIVTLGKRILRTETAAPAMLAIIMNILGEI
jgi:16S rRNA (uracil1498-N3)-methyltransferase